MRVLRLLIYEGSEYWIQDTFSRCQIQGKRIIGVNKTITSIFLGKLPDEIEMFIKEKEVAE